MKLFEEWKKQAYEIDNQEDYNKFWNTYLEEEKSIYQNILSDNCNRVEGTLCELSEKYKLDVLKICGFLDGVNASLEEKVDIDSLEESSKIDITINFEKLYYNMLDAKAPWLYQLKEWDNILSEEKRKEITKKYRDDNIVRVTKIGRNEPCPCNSGKKYKKCCGK